MPELYRVIPFPDIWPPNEEIVSLSLRSKNLTIETRFLPTGQLRFSVTEGQQNTVTSFESQPIDISNGGLALLRVAWDQTSMELDLNRNRVLSAGTNVPRMQLKIKPQIPISSLLSFENPDGANACQSWVAFRRTDLFARQRKRRQILKTPDEQADDLCRSVLLQQRLVEMLQNGEGFAVGALATELRSLLYWNNGTTYDPLLLRLADKANLPLPIYRLKPMPVPAGMPLPDVLHINSGENAPKLRSILTNDELVDLQQWLTEEAMSIDASPRICMPAMDLIADTAHTLGGAHYDQDASPFIEILRKSTAYTQDLLAHFLCDLSLTVIGLSNWILSELRARNLIS